MKPQFWTGRGAVDPESPNVLLLRVLRALEETFEDKRQEDAAWLAIYNALVEREIDGEQASLYLRKALTWAATTAKKRVATMGQDASHDFLADGWLPWPVLNLQLVQARGCFEGVPEPDASGLFLLTWPVPDPNGEEGARHRCYVRPHPGAPHLWKIEWASWSAVDGGVPVEPLWEPAELPAFD